MSIRGGRNIAMKVPPSQFRTVVESYRALGLPILHESDSLVTFDYGPIKLHIDQRETFSQAELWLEFIADDLADAASSMDSAGFIRCDEIEGLEGHSGFWVKNSASIVHLVTEDE